MLGDETILLLKKMYPTYSNTNIGEYSYGCPKLMFEWQWNNNLTIGNYCSIAQGCTFFLGGNHDLTNISTFPFDCRMSNDAKYVKGSSINKGGIQIGNDVWIGANVTIMPGVTIADGCVIGTDTTVAKSILDPYSIVVGNPCKIIKKRFSDDEIQFLMKAKWWNYENNFVKMLFSSLNQSDFTIFRDTFKTTYKHFFNEEYDEN